MGSKGEELANRQDMGRGKRRQRRTARAQQEGDRVSQEKQEDLVGRWRQRKGKERWDAG